MNKLFSENDFNLIKKKHNLSLGLIIGFPIFLVIFLVFSFIFITRENEKYFFFIMLVITILLVMAIVFSACYFSFYNSYFKLFNNVLNGEKTIVEGMITLIEEETISLEENIKVTQVHVLVKKEPFIIYVLNNYETSLKEKKTCKFVVSGNFLLEYKEI